MARVRRIATVAVAGAALAAPLVAAGVAQGAAKPGNATRGKAVFIANCGSCHTLSQARTRGQVGPNLNRARPTYALTVTRVTRGRGVMPAFRGRLTTRQIQDVARFVSNSTSKR